MDHQPKTLTVPEAGRRYFDLSRNASYEAARRPALARRYDVATNEWSELRFKNGYREPNVATHEYNPLDGLKRS